MKEKGIPDVGMARSQGGLPCLSLIRVNESEEALIDMTLQAVAHEIRNPLMVIGAFARKLVETLDDSSASTEYARVLLRETVRLETLLSLMVEGNRLNTPRR
jgi:nitrogen-specific signal transduction histidine kinase